MTNGAVTTTDYLSGFQYITSPSRIVELQFIPTAEGYVKSTGNAFQYVFNYTDHLGNVRISYSDLDGDGVVGWELSTTCYTIEPKIPVDDDPWPRESKPINTIGPGWMPPTPPMETHGDGNVVNDSNIHCVNHYTSSILEENNYYPFGLKHSPYNGVNSQSDYKYKYNGKEFQDELGLNVYDYGARNYDAAIGRWMNVDPLAEKFTSETLYAYVNNDPLGYSDFDGKDYTIDITRD